MAAIQHTLILSLLPLVAYVSCSRAEETFDSKHYRPAEENITRTLIDMTQESLFRSFGINMKRKPSKSFTPHDYMIEVYSLLSGNADVARRTRINTVRGIIDTDKSNEALFRILHQIYHFDISGLPKEEEVLGCEFRLFWSPLKVASRFRRSRFMQQRKLYQIVLLGIVPDTNQIRSNSTTSKRLRIMRLATHVFDLAMPKPKWISFDKIGQFSRLLKDGNIGVMKLAAYVIDRSNGRIISPDDVGFDKRGRNDKEKGLVVMFSNDKKKKREEDEYSKGRTKRGARRGRRKDRKSHARRRSKALCRRRKMYVNFDDFGWTNWIIAPKGYDAYYCRGSCAFPIPGHLNPTSHAVIQSTISSMNSQFMKPACCVPDKLKSIAMLYLDTNDRVVYQKKEDMVVVSCACK